MNLIVAASGNDAKSLDLMKVEPGHGAVYVTRYGPKADVHGRFAHGADVSSGWMKIDNVDDGKGANREPQVTLRARVDGVLPGDLLDIDAVIEARVDDGPCDPLILNQVFVTSSATPDPEQHKISGLTAQNGTNCLDRACSFRKSGAGQLPKGVPTTVVVSVVSKAGRSCVQPGDRWALGNGSGLRVRLRR